MFQDEPPVVPSGVVVSGEASESDEDEMPSSVSPSDLPPLRGWCINDHSNKQHHQVVNTHVYFSRRGIRKHG